MKTKHFILILFSYFGKSVIGKAANKGLLYAGIGNASAFAFNDRDTYLAMTGRSFLQVSGGGFFNGFMQGLGNNPKFLENSFRGNEMDAALAFRYAGLTTDLLMSVAGVTKENPYDYYKLASKQNMSYFKLLFYNLAVE